MRALLFAVVVLSLGISSAAPGAEVDLPRFPSVSPDGEQVVFSWRGDLWRVGIEGGEAVRLTSDPSNDLASAWSPDGQTIAFESDRSGRRSIYLMGPGGEDVRLAGYVDGTLSLSGFSADGQRVLCAGFIEGDVYRGARAYSVSIDGGMLERIHGAFGQYAVERPDGGVYAFERGGSRTTRRHYRGPDDRDLFLYDSGADRFTRVTDWAGNDTRPKWRDDDTLVYLSDRAGETVNLWTIELDEGEDNAVAVTSFTDRDITWFDVSANGRRAVFSKWDGLYRMTFRGKRAGEAERIEITAPDDAVRKNRLKSVDRLVSEAALSPDGKTLAVVAFGDVFVRSVEDDQPTRQVTSGAARERGVAWSPDNGRLYFVSDTGGTDSVYAATVSLTRDEIAERFEEITNPEPVEGAESDEEAGGEEGGAEGADVVEDAAEDSESEEAESEGGDEAEEEEEKIDHGSRWTDALRFEIEPVVVNDFDDRSPRLSPDGLSMALRRTRGDVVVVDLVTGDERTVFESWDYGVDFRWSPDGEWLAISSDDSNFNSDIYLVRADGTGEAVNISQHPDNDYYPRWSGDGKILAFISERQNDGYDLFMVMLDRDLEAMTSLELEAYFEERTKAAKKLGAIDGISFSADDEAEAVEDEGDEEEAETTEPAFSGEDLADAYRRLRRVTTFPGNETQIELSLAGDRLLYSAQAGAGGSSGLYSIKWDRSDETKLVSSGSMQSLTRDGTKLVYVASGQAGMVPIGGGKAETVGIDAEVEVDHSEMSRQKFGELARTLGRTFYHPTMKGLDWAQLSSDYAELAARAYTSNEFAEIGSRFMGELNASHLGVSPPSDTSAPDYRPSGRLGIDVVDESGGLRVTRVLPRAKTNSGKMAIREGDLITGIELEPIGAGESLDTLLAGRSGEETIVTVTRVLEDGAEAVSLDLLVTPISTGTERRLRYDAWQLRRAALVEEWSGGRLGYLHIRSMGGADLIEFERDLYAAANGRDGLLVDVRNNGGGWTADRVMASLMYPQHAYTIPRGADPIEGQGYPRDRLYIQRYNKPVNMLCNEKSFSNAEIVSHAFKTLGRGTLVGEETYGGVISTGAFSLVDGTRVRQPFRGWFVLSGADMENAGAVPDIRIEQSPEDEALDEDRQLRAAVDDLMSRLD